MSKKDDAVNHTLETPCVIRKSYMNCQEFEFCIQPDICEKQKQCIWSGCDDARRQASKIN